jgi:hypothetical protein
VSALPGYDLPCVACGYDLRGLDVNGRCPECGVPIAETIGGQLLASADPLWVHRVSLGVTAAYITTLAWLGLVGWGYLARPGAPFDWIYHSLSGTAQILIHGGDLLGVWLFTTPEPSPLRTGPVASTRRLLRTFVVAEFALRVAPPHHPSDHWFVVSTVLGTLLPAVMALLFYRHLRALAERMLDVGLVSHATILQWVAPASAVLIGVLPWLDPIASLIGIRSPDVPPELAPLGWWAVGIYAVIVLAQARSRFRATTLEARDNWEKRVASLEQPARDGVH